MSDEQLPDYEFIILISDDETPNRPTEKTGWESVIFDLEDDPLFDARFRRSGSRSGDAASTDT